MSDQLTAEAPADATPFASLEELKAEHSTLLRRRRGGFVDNPSAFLGEVETFLKRGYATGSILGDEAERYSAQSLLSYWSNVLYREGREVPEDALAEFDPGQAPELADTECPYVGLGQQQEGDQPLRSPGWSRLLDESLKVIEKERFLAIVGANGSGRHPLIHGGILPALRNGAIKGSEDWRILPSIVPGADPLSELLRHLHPEADTTWIEQQLAALRAEPARLVGLSDDGDQRPVVLVIEQFGELFEGSDRSQIRPFSEALLALAQDPDARHIIILGTRPDNLSLISAIGGFGKLFQRNQVLMSFTNRELRQMVEEPAKRVGLKYDDGVVDRLLLDVQGDPAALTLLQFNLQLLWKNRQGNRITHEIYDGIGGGRLAVARQAERVYSSLSPEQQKAVKLAFLKLVRVESGTRVILQRVPRRQLVFPEVSSGVINAALDRVIDGQILVSREGPGSGESSLRLVHEAAATSWPRCVEWLDEFRARHRWQLGLRTAAEQWRDKGKNCGALWRGGALEQAGDERARFLEAGGELSPLEEQFLDASQKAEKRGIWLKRGLITSAIAGLLVIAVLSSAVFYLGQKAAQASEAKAKAEAAAKKRLADQEARSRHELGLTISHWSTAVARWLEESEGDSTGAFVWLGEAWKGLLENKQLLESGQGEDLMRDYRLRLGMALRRLPRISRLLDHKDLVAAAVSDDRSWAASVGPDGTVKRWRIPEGTPESWRLTETPIRIENASVSISPEGNYVVVCTSDCGASGQVLVRDIAANKTIHLPYNRPVTMAEFCPRSREPLLATVGELENRKGEIRLWRVGTWEAETLEAPGIIKHIAVSQDGNRLAAAGKNENGGSGFCREWDLTQPRMSRQDYFLPGYGRNRDANYVAYHCDANGKPLRLAVACGAEGEDQNYVCVFDVGDPGKPPALSLPHRRAVNQVSFSPDGKKLVTAGQDGTARIWVIRQGPMQSPPRTLIHNSPVISAEFSLDGQFVATASDLRARVWDAETGEPVSCPLQHSGSVDYAKFTSDGRQLITQSPDMLHVWDLTSGAAPSFRFAVPSSIDHDHVCCDPKTLRVAAAGYQPARHQGWARVWDGKSGMQLTPELPHPGRVIRSALSPNGGPFLATICDDSSLRVWNLASGQQTCELKPSGIDQLRFVTFSPDGAWLVAAGGDRAARRGVARVYSVSKDGKISPEKLDLRHEAPITIAVFNQRGDRFITVTGDSELDRGEAKIWDRSGHSIDLKDKAGSAHPQGIKSAAFSGDGQLLVTTSSDKSARVWNVHDGSLVHALEGHTAEVVSASFSESGEYVATSSRDGKAIVWKLGSREPFALLPHKNPVNHAIFTHDTRYLVTACEDGAARIWAIDGGGHPVAIRRQSGTVMQVGYTGEDQSSTIGIFSLQSPIQSSEYNVGVGAWDISPVNVPTAESLLSFGTAIAARRRTLISGGEVKLETISGDELKKAYEDSLPLADVLLGPTAGPEEWHDRMARVFDANRWWSAAVWHLDCLASEPRAPVTTYLRRARAHSELGRTEKRPDSLNLSLALKDYSRVLDAESRNGPIYLERAEIQLDLQNLDEAVKDFSKAEQLVGGTKRVWTGRAKARSRQQLWQPAIEDYLKALQADPGDGSVHGQLAEAYFNLKDWKKAIEAFDQAAQKQPNNLEFKERRADAVLELKDLPQAIKEYAEVAANYRRQKQFKKAIEIYRKALDLKPENVGRLHVELAETYSMEGRLDKEAIAEYMEALKREPKEWRYWLKLAALHEKLEAWDDASQAYSKAIDLTPGELTPLQARARFFTHRKQWNLAAQDYEAAVKSDPNKPWLRTELAGLYVEAGKLDEAIRCFEQMAKASANDVMPDLRVATIQLMRGDTGGYQATCERLLGRFEQVKNVATANNAAWACALGPSAVKDMGRAVRLAQWAVQTQPGNSNYRDTLGAVYYRAGDMEATIRELSQSRIPAEPSSSFRPGLTVVYDRLFLAMALHRFKRAKRAEEAKELLEAAIDQLETNRQNQNGFPTGLAIEAWQRRELNLLRTEAENLIKPKR